MEIALYPGSFDPFHNGHLEIVDRASRHFDRLVVAAVGNPQKNTAMFTLDERVEMIAASLEHLPNVSVEWWSRAVVDLARRLDATVIVKGLRAASDFESELQMAHMNRALSGIDTVFFPSSSEHSFLASRLLKEVAKLGHDVSEMVPEPVAKRLAEKLAQ